MKNKILTLAAAATALLLTGCTGVYSPQPFGDKPHALAAADWDGTWATCDSAMLVRVTDSAAGKLQYSETKVEKGAFVTKTTDIFVRESGDWLFVSVVDDSTRDRYEWARIRRDGDQVIVWVPDKDAFRALVQSGKLKGRLVDQGVILDPLSAGQMKALTSGALGVPFKWAEPSVIHRLAR